MAAPFLVLVLAIITIVILDIEIYLLKPSRYCFFVLQMFLECICKTIYMSKNLLNGVDENI
jgi:hypothetical protein